MKQCSLKKWFKSDRVETKAEEACGIVTKQEGTVERIGPDTVELTEGKLFLRRKRRKREGT